MKFSFHNSAFIIQHSFRGFRGMGTIHIDDYNRDVNQARFRVVLVIVLIIFSMLVIRLAFLQIFQGRRYEKMSRAQKLRELTLPPVRGNILDRNGHPLAATRDAFRLLLYADPSLKEVSDLSGTISELLNIPKEEVEKRFALRKQTALFQPTTLLANISRDDVAAIEENLTGLGGLEVEQISKRVYPQGNTSAQLIGYIGEVSGKDLDPISNKEYRPGDLTGRMGIEEAWEETLRGINGAQQVVVDSTGRRNELFERELRLPDPAPPTPGNNIELTIDLDLQRAAEQALGDNAGAAVVMDVQSGELLALASTPGFDPNHMVSEMDTSEWQELVNDPRHPFHNRPIQGEYPPASVYKIVVAAAALEEGVVRPEDTFRCDGVVEIGTNQDKYHCWKPGGHGVVDAYRGIAESCDVYFYRVGERLGIDTLQKYSVKFGLGYPPGLDLPGEKSGLVPDPLWKQRRIGKPWYLGDTVITAIGQGYTLVTPLQAARIVSVIASGGQLVRPRIVRRILTRDGKVVREFVKQVEITQVISPEVCKILTRAMVGVVNDPHGTGYNFLGYNGVQVAGKTGTAQVIARSRKESFLNLQGEIPWEYRDHSWFVGFAPASNPRIAVSVLVEHGGPGSSVAEPICGRIIKHYMENQYRQIGGNYGSP